MYQFILDNLMLALMLAGIASVVSLIGWLLWDKASRPIDPCEVCISHLDCRNCTVERRRYRRSY